MFTGELLNSRGVCLLVKNNNCASLIITLMVQKSGDHHLGFVQNRSELMGFQLPTSTSERWIPEPSTVFHHPPNTPEFSNS